MPSTSLSLDQPSLDKKALRRTLRQRRRALTPRRQIFAAQRLASRLAKRPEFVSADTLALYLAADGEIGTRAIIELAWRVGKRVYLPVLQPVLCDGNRLRFAEYRPGARLHRNRLGIPEPRIKRYCDARYLDLVLMPLVGFDAAGGRLGMGGGFYDRSFAFVRERQRRRPVLVGLAHQCQQVEHLPAEVWDVPMAAIATDRRWLPVRRLGR